MFEATRPGVRDITARLFKGLNDPRTTWLNPEIKKRGPRVL